MKKTLYLVIVAALLLCLCACSNTSTSGDSAANTSANTAQDTTGSTLANPDSLSIDDMYLYDSNGQRAETTVLSLSDYADYAGYSTFRGVKPGDPVSILAERYNLSDFTVLQHGDSDDKKQTATVENILSENSLLIEGNLVIDNKDYSLCFSIDRNGVVYTIAAFGQ